MNKEEIKLYSWIVRGSQRMKILQAIEKPITPTQIKSVTGFALNNVSDILRLFVKHKIAKCLNEEEKLGRIYELTEKGRRIKKLLS
jgi:predicted transcriptional regulator